MNEITDKRLDALTGGAVPPAPSLAAPVRPKFGARTMAVRKPGEIPSPANRAAAPSRQLGGFAAPDENELRNMQRVDKLRGAINALVSRNDAALREIAALVKELQGTSGGAAVAERLQFPLQDAADLVVEMAAVLDKFFPPA